MVNQDSSQYPTALMRALFDRFMGPTGRDWSGEMLADHRTRLERKDSNPVRQAAERAPGTRPSRPLAAYAGTYSHPGYGPVVVSLDGDALSVEASGERSPLIHWQYDVFAAASTDHMGMWAAEGWMSRISFATSPQGRISELTISAAPGISFQRQPD
jgi:hypothetical protein